MSEQRYFKITNQDEVHYGFQYCTGLNIDVLPFSETGICVPGGLYFTTAEYLHNFFDNGRWIREVSLPENARWIKVESSDHSVPSKWRSDSLILGRRWDIGDPASYATMVGCNLPSMDWAARNGHMDCLEWLHSHGMDNTTTDAMDQAAEFNRIDVLEWLYSHGMDRTTTNAMDWAARNGHLDCLEWLHSHGKECTTKAMDWAAKNGQLATLKWLHAHGKKRTKAAIDWASLRNHTDCLEWLRSPDGKQCMTKRHIGIRKYIDRVSRWWSRK
jgi:Ankyrin repeats (3 copies)